MRKFFRHQLWAILVLLGCCTQTASATHLMGSDLTYEYLGNGVYKVKFVGYRDCNGIPISPTMPLDASSVSCNFRQTFTMPLIMQQEITPVCPGVVGSACANPKTGVYGIEKYTYETTVTLSNANNCTDIQFSWDNCCRNGAITNLVNPMSQDMTISAYVVGGMLTNSSPIFTNDPTPFLCANQPFQYNHGATDADGDDLRYSLVPCQQTTGATVTGGSASVNYAAGRSATDPLWTTNGVQIDANTGAISFTASQRQVAVVCVLVEEYRNGVKIGSVVRDVQFTVLNCTNQMPTLSGINGTNDYCTTATAGQNICFNVNSADVDNDQQTFLTYGQAIPNATFSGDNGVREIGTFCWTPTVNDVGVHSFTVQVRDNACPLVGLNIYTYCISVVAPAVPPCGTINVQLGAVNNLKCSNRDGSAVLTATGGTAPYNYQLVNWTNNQFFNNNTGIFNNLTAGNYGVVVTDANGCNAGCTGLSFDITGNVRPFAGQVTVSQPSCGGGNGAAGMIISGGTAPYLFGINGQNFQSSPNFSGIAPGFYQLVAIDANGCYLCIPFTISRILPIQASATVQNALCGNANGSATVTATGGRAPFNFISSNGSNNTGIFANLANGNYSITVTDANRCSAIVTFTVASTPSVVASISEKNILCANTCTGELEASATGGLAPYSFAWSNNSNTANLQNLCEGRYSLTVTDANGCSSVETAEIIAPAELVATLASSTAESCAGRDGEAVVAVAGGTAPYNIQAANFGNRQNYQSSTGEFTGLQAGYHTVQVRDANGCVQNCALNFTLEGCNNNVPVAQRPQAGSNDYVTLSPNPTNYLVQISYRMDAAKSIQVSIIDVNGKVLMERSNLANSYVVEANVNGWAAATYFVILRDENGQMLNTKPLVVK